MEGIHVSGFSIEEMKAANWRLQFTVTMTDEFASLAKLLTDDDPRNAVLEHARQCSDVVVRLGGLAPVVPIRPEYHRGMTDAVPIAKMDGSGSILCNRRGRPNREARDYMLAENAQIDWTQSRFVKKG